ncbi:hypothetical protein ACPEIC_11595 [Stenotrophomonas sp. NPDC087984]
MSNETVEVWYARARLTLAAWPVPRETADTVLNEVGQHCAESGEHPREAFGSPAEFASMVAAERVPDQIRAAYDRDGLTPADRISGVFGLLGMSTVVAGVWLWISAGGTLTLTKAGLAGTVLTTLALATALVAAHGPRSGARRRAVGWWCVSAATTILAAIAFTALPRTGLGTLPTPIVCLAGVVWKNNTACLVPARPSSLKKRPVISSMLTGRPGTNSARWGCTHSGWRSRSPAGCAGRQGAMHGRPFSPCARPWGSRSAWSMTNRPG